MLNNDSDATVIPSTVTARVSIRIVPDQDLDTISKALQEHLKSQFATIQSSNQIEVNLAIDIIVFVLMKDNIGDHFAHS